jgi:hypothetical protein
LAVEIGRRVKLIQILKKNSVAFRRFCRRKLGNLKENQQKFKKNTGKNRQKLAKIPSKMAQNGKKSAKITEN